MDEELEALYDVDEDAAAWIDVLLEELADSDLLERLYRPERHFRHEPPFEIKRFEEAQRRGKNILILKIWNESDELLPYRVMFGHDAQNDIYYVLAVAGRGDAYEPGKKTFNDLLDRYEQNGLPTYPH